MVRDAMVWFVWYEFIRFIYDPGAGCTLSLGFMCQVSDASNWARRRFRAWSCSGSKREEARQTKHDKTTRLCQQLVTSFRTSILLVQRWLEMSCGHPKVFLAIFVWHNFGKDFQQADAIRSQLQDIRPFGWVFSTSKSILSILSILSISILLCILCAFHGTFLPGPWSWTLGQGETVEMSGKRRAEQFFLWRKRSTGWIARWENNRKHGENMENSISSKTPSFCRRCEFCLCRSIRSVQVPAEGPNLRGQVLA